ncbi:MAG: uroporphyrinogen decarboxylase family protein [Candidatus Latescibacterota bacterium]
MSPSPVDTILALLEPDAERLGKGRERTADVWWNREPDGLPLLAGTGETPEREKYPHYTLKEQFADRDKMLSEHLWGMIATARGTGDGQPSLRANLGVGFIPSLFGLESRFVQEDQMPWVMGTLSREEIAHLEIPDVRNAGLMPRALEYISYFEEKLNGKGRVYPSDTQGPFDIAHLLRGHDLYTDLYDDPEWVHRLMHVATETYIAVSRVLKEALGEPLDSGIHTGMAMEHGGVRVCDDSSINLSGAMFREFVQPYLAQALAPFGGGWYHFCGKAHHMLPAMLEIEGVRGINFGNPEFYDFAAVLPELLKRGKFYVGAIPPHKGEDAASYRDRILGYLGGQRKGLILQSLAIGEGQSAREAVDIWRG